MVGAKSTNPVVREALSLRPATNALTTKHGSTTTGLQRAGQLPISYPISSQKSEPRYLSAASCAIEALKESRRLSFQLWSTVEHRSACSASTAATICCHLQQYRQRAFKIRSVACTRRGLRTCKFYRANTDYSSASTLPYPLHEEEEGISR